MKPEKCGEIIRYAPGKFVFSCSHCSESFTSKSAALSHFESHFLVQFTTELKVDCIEESHEIEALERLKEEKCDENIIVPVDHIKEEETLELYPEDSAFLNQLEGLEVIKEQTPIYGKKKAFKTVELNLINASKRINSRDRLLLVKNNVKWGPQHCKNTTVECDICGNQLKKFSLTSHFLSHLNQKQFVCELCQRGYNTASQLKRHLNVHSVVKRYSCDYCGWLFHDRTNLIVHIRRHTGEKPYKCKGCDKSFAQSSALISHNRIHTGEKPYKCKLCERVYSTRNMLQRHALRHIKDKPYECKLCSKTFTTTKSLRDHRRSQHTGERPYVCQVCNTSYARRNSYKQHIVLHTGEKKYKCRACDLCFAQAAGRRSHEKSIHKDVAHLLINT